MHHISNTLQQQAETLFKQGPIQIQTPQPMHAPLSDYFSSSDSDTTPTPQAPSTLAPTPAPAPVPLRPPAAVPVDIASMKQSIHQMKDQLDAMLRLLDGTAPLAAKPATPAKPVLAGDEEIIEGVFNGEQMVGQDGKTYPISPNYASKSKLVEGDMLKLTITQNGRLIYKQIGPIARKHVRGELIYDAPAQKWTVLANGRLYRVLTASVTFHKGTSGDEVMLILPESGESQWGAVETIISK